MTISQKTRKAQQFFTENAGYVVGRRAAGALELARAEEWLEEQGNVRAVWVSSEGPYEMGDNEDEMPREVFDCLIVWFPSEEAAESFDAGSQFTDLGGEIVASLGSIGDPGRKYRRVVEAELAEEARARVAELDRAHGLAGGGGLGAAMRKIWGG